MDYNALRTAILARDDCAAAVAAKNCQAIAEIMSVGRTRLVQKYVGVGTVMSTLGAAHGAEVLKQIQGQVSANPVIEYAWMLLDLGAFDLGDQETHTQLDLLAAGRLMTPNDAEKLKALGRAADSVTAQAIALALYESDGSLK